MSNIDVKILDAMSESELIYGSYKMRTCKKIIHDIFENSGRFPNGSYLFPAYDD